MSLESLSTIKQKRQPPLTHINVNTFKATHPSKTAVKMYNVTTTVTVSAATYSLINLKTCCDIGGVW